jgi:hypothetical protein
VGGIPELLGDAEVLEHSPGDVETLTRNLLSLDSVQLASLSASATSRWHGFAPYSNMIDGYSRVLTELSEPSGSAIPE